MRLSLILCCYLVFLTGCAQVSLNNVLNSRDQQQSMTDSDKREYIKALEGIKKKRLKKAQVILNRLLKKYPDASGVLANKGLIYAKKAKLDKAETFLEKALQINDKLVQARNHLAVVYRKQGKFSEAGQMLQAAIVTNPYYANAYYNLGILNELYLDEPAIALENYRLYLDLKKGGDKRVSQWVSLLQRQLKSRK
ncbi:MAG: tetratricopeptide repeat protein [Gammaproteobacteria bacterium]|nr:tetratricopeptide repeat protein [Gammaproteobacteria bacterium]